MVFVYIIVFIVCVLLTLVVLVQESKGGGLASGFSSANQMIGVKRTTEFLEKATWGLAIGLMVLCLTASYLGGGAEIELEDKSSRVQDYLEEETIVLPNQQPQPAQPQQ